MNIITNLLKKDYNLIDYKYADELIVPTIFSSYFIEPFDENDILNLRLKTDKGIIINIDKIIFEKELTSVFDFIDKLIKYDFHFMFSDLAVLSYFIKLNQLDKLIYNSPTYICNRFDIEYYQKLGIKVFMSNELSIDDLHINSKYDNCIITCYGYYPIYYSKRKVLSLYKNYTNLEYNPNSLDLEIKELSDKTNIENNTSYKILENNQASVIFSSKKICVFKELNECKYDCIFINSFKTDNIGQVLKIYKDAMNSSFSLELYKCILNIDERLDSSLLYLNPSILNKENA